ncbi:MAG: hypothetical protein M3N37_01260 [Actinomycetota bacterium]|nr:hypothetical protein [Actinomycetota bacterium]
MSGTGGLDPATIKPPDAVTALRSFPRRWRSALAMVADDPGADELVRRRPDVSSWSALEHAWYVAELLRRSDERVAQLRREEGPVLDADDPRRWVDGGGYGDRGLEAALGRISEQAPKLAETLEALGPDDWLRSGRLDGADVTLLALVQRTVADTADHLRAAERALRSARRGG